MGRQPHISGVVIAAAFATPSLADFAVFESRDKWEAAVGDFTTITRSHTLREGLNTDKGIFEIGIVLLEKALASEKQGIRLVGIGVSRLMEPSRQRTLFSPSNRKLEELSKAIDRIRDRYGFDAIQTGRTIMLKDLLQTK